MQSQEKLGSVSLLAGKPGSGFNFTAVEREEDSVILCLFTVRSCKLPEVSTRVWKQIIIGKNDIE